MWLNFSLILALVLTLLIIAQTLSQTIRQAPSYSSRHAAAYNLLNHRTKPHSNQKSDELNHRSNLYFTSYNVFLPYVTFLIPLTKMYPKGLSLLLNISVKSLTPLLVLIA